MRRRSRGAARGGIGRRTSTGGLAALAAAILVGPLGLPRASAAPFVDVTYDLGDSSAVSVVDTGFQLLETLSPPQLSGTMKIRYASDSGSGLVVGPSTLLTFNLSVHATVGLTYVTASGATGSSTVNTATLRFQLTTPVPGGTLLPGGTVDPQGGIGQLRLTGTVHCYLLCGVLGISATSPTGVNASTFSQPLGLLYGAVGTPHTVTGTQHATFYVDPGEPGGGFQAAAKVIATTFIVGREVRRDPVPEPGTLPLLGVGVVGFGAFALLRWRLARTGH